MGVTLNYSQTGVTPPANSVDAYGSAYQWILGWAVAILLLTLASKTKLGYTLIYYWLVLLILFLVVTQYQYIVDALGPLGKPVPSSS